MPTNYRYQAITNTDNTDDDQAQLISSTTAISSTSFPGNLTTAEMILNSSRFTAEKCITVWLNVLLTIFTAYLMLCELNVVRTKLKIKFKRFILILKYFFTRIQAPFRLPHPQKVTSIDWQPFQFTSFSFSFSQFSLLAFFAFTCP